jgi:SpoVK/Ycf46/Vps4 family AAA+-type ATPase
MLLYSRSGRRWTLSTRMRTSSTQRCSTSSASPGHPIPLRETVVEVPTVKWGNFGGLKKSQETGVSRRPLGAQSAAAAPFFDRFNSNAKPHGGSSGSGGGTDRILNQNPNGRHQHKEESAYDRRD